MDNLPMGCHESCSVYKDRETLKEVLRQLIESSDILLTKPIEYRVLKTISDLGIDFKPVGEG